MDMKRRTLLGGALALALAIGGVGVANAVGGDDDTQATGPGADKATAAALALTGGTANAVERDGEDGATWEVEVAKPDGSTVDVRLGAHYERVVIEPDSEAPGDR
jgi:uncharacterized membrane protein YkoI